jgi:hypothetical protein
MRRIVAITAPVLGVVILLMALARISGQPHSEFVYHRFYDFHGGWFGIPTVTAMLFLYAGIGILTPRRRRGKK